MQASFIYDCTPRFVHLRVLNTSRYTGKERDAESGLDFFGARYYASTTGRWMSPDWAEKPEDVPYATMGDPQSLNLYNYVGNNPLSRADADGHMPDWVKGVWDGVKSGVGDTVHGLVTLGQASQGDPNAAAAVGLGVAGMAKDGYNMAAHPLQTAAGVKAGWKSMSGREKAALITDTGVKGAIAIGAEAVGGELAGAGEAGAGEAAEGAIPRSIPAGPSARPTAAQQSAINEMGNAHGCNTCGATSPGTKTGNWVGDHQPPTALNTSGGPQVYEPQCLTCMYRQGGQVSQAVQAAKKAEAPQ